MGIKSLVILCCTIVATEAWSPYYPVHRAPPRPMRFTRFARVPPPVPTRHRIPIPSPVREAVIEEPQEPTWRSKRNHHDYDNHDYDHDHSDSSGVTGPVHTFVKTDKNANYKWGVRHHVGNKFAS